MIKSVFVSIILLWFLVSFSTAQLPANYLNSFIALQNVRSTWCIYSTASSEGPVLGGSASGCINFPSQVFKFVPVRTNVYVILHRYSGRCLYLDGSNLRVGSDCTDTPRQTFTLLPLRLPTGVITYRIRNLSNSRCIEDDVNTRQRPVTVTGDCTTQGGSQDWIMISYMIPYIPSNFRLSGDELQRSYYIQSWNGGYLHPGDPNPLGVKALFKWYSYAPYKFIPVSTTSTSVYYAIQYQLGTAYFKCIHSWHPWAGPIYHGSDCTATEGQMWELIPRGGNKYSFRHIYSKNCMYIEDDLTARVGPSCEGLKETTFTLVPHCG